MKKIILTLTILVFLTAQNFAQKIEYSLAVAKDTFLLCENIPWLLTMKNMRSNEILTIEKKVRWYLKNQNNEEVPLGYWSRSIAEFEFNKTLNNGEEIILHSGDILFTHGKQYSKNILVVHIPEGRYFFQLIISDYNNNEIVVSDSFLVKNPLGDESYVLNTFVELTDRFHTPDDLNNLYFKFPNSVYMFQILQHISALYFNYFNDPIKDKELSKILIEDYPTFHTTKTVKNYLGSIENPTVRAEIYNKIKMKVRGTMFEKFYEQELKEFEEK